MTINHAKTATTPDDPDFEVGSGEWNAGHVGDWPAADVALTDAAGYYAADNVEELFFDMFAGATSFMNRTIDQALAIGTGPGGISFTTDTTLTDVDGCTIGFNYNADNFSVDYWQVDTHIMYEAGTGGDIKVGFVCDGSFFWYGMGVGTGASSDTNALKMAAQSGTGNSLTYGGAGTGTSLGLKLTLFLTVAPPDGVQLQLQAAQGTSNGTATNIQQAYMVARKVGSF